MSNVVCVSRIVHNDPPTFSHATPSRFAKFCSVYREERPENVTQPCLFPFRTLVGENNWSAIRIAAVWG